MRTERSAGSLIGLAIASVMAIAIAWRVVVVNMAEHFGRAATDAQDAMAALKWDARQAEALYAEGHNDSETNPPEARKRLKAAILANPSDGRSYAALALIYEKEQNTAAADAAMATAGAMAPRRVDVQQDAAAYWMRRGDVRQAMEHWNVVLKFAPEVWPKVFPSLLLVAQDPRNHQAFAPLLKEEILWWPQFFRYVASNAQRLETVRALYSLQLKGPNDATPEALKAYLERLQREGYWTESYFAWLNSLPNDQTKSVGNIFNGGFEEPLSNLGFDWISTPAGYILVETAPTYGITGQRALHVVFRGPRQRFRHFGQYLMLPAGEFSLRGRARPESLETQGAVQWGVYCLDGDEALGKSERFAGTDQWRHFSFQFTVPADCPIQLLRLEVAGRAWLDYETKGGIWFDDIAVDRLTRLD